MRKVCGVQGGGVFVASPGFAVVEPVLGGYDALGRCDDLSTCRSASQLPLCIATDESCKQSNETIEWILQEFRNTPVSSTELLAQDTLENLANQTFVDCLGHDSRASAGGDRDDRLLGGHDLERARRVWAM